MDFKIVREESLQTGVRRIMAKTGRSLRSVMHGRYGDVTTMSQSMKVAPDQVVERVQSLLDENRKLKKQMKDGPVGVDVASTVDDLLAGAEKVSDATLVVGELPPVSIDKIRVQVDRIKKKVKDVVIVFGTRGDGKVLLLTAVSDSMVDRGLSAVDIVRKVAKTVGGGGGGKERLAQAGGKLPEKLPDALAETKGIVSQLL